MSGTYINFDAVKRVPITAVLARLGILETLRRSGSRLVGVCPIHRGTNKRQFSVDENKGLWTCFGDCHASGSAIDLVAALHGVAVRDAAALIGEWFAIQSRTPATSSVNYERRKRVSGHPTHKVFAVRDADPDDANAKPWYTRIGSAWPIKSGKGLSIQLDALPVGDRLVLFEFENDEEAQKEEQHKPKRGKR